MSGEATNCFLLERKRSAAVLVHRQGMKIRKTLITFENYIFKGRNTSLERIDTNIEKY
jgi:hypothetical protein